MDIRFPAHLLSLHMEGQLDIDKKNMGRDYVMKQKVL